MEYHKLADLFPMMGKDELKGLCDDMRNSGYDATAPIMLLDGKILDGRNRQLAADTVGVIPAYTRFDGDDPLAFVIRRNLHRRHLNETQRAIIASKMANMPNHRPEDKSANLQTSITAAAEMLNVSPRTVATVKAIERDAPQFIERMASGEMTAAGAKKKVAEIEKAERKSKPATIPDDELFTLYCLPVNQLKSKLPPGSIDIIITDPPYPKEYIEVFSDLSELADYVLKPGGSLVVMSGQSYLPEVVQRLSEKMVYQWMLSYVMPGGLSPQIWQRKVNTFWKPLLWFVKGEYSGDWIGDVIKCAPNDNDKEYHHWGQNVAGMEDIIERFTNPGQMILDPFCGGGTTGMAAVTKGRRFIGSDNAESCINTSRGRYIEWKLEPKELAGVILA